MNISKLLSRPIAFHRPFVAISGSVTAALFLSQLHYWTPRGRVGGGWIYKTRDEWTDETGLTRTEQETARKKLIAKGLMEEKLRGVPARLHYRINIETLNTALESLCSEGDDAGDLSWQESRHPVGGNPANKKAGKLPTISETTAETTAEKEEGDLAITGIVIFPYPKSEKEMEIELHRHCVPYNPDYDGDFFNQMTASRWKIRGEPIFDWIATYRARTARIDKGPSDW